MEDPGFPEVGVPTLQGAPTYYFAKFPPELHKIVRIWTPRGRTSLMPHLRSATGFEMRMVLIVGSKGVRGTCTPLGFLCSSGENLVGDPWRVGAPTSGNPGSVHCKHSFFLNRSREIRRKRRVNFSLLCPPPLVYP